MKNERMREGWQGEKDRMKDIMSDKERERGWCCGVGS